MVFFLPGKYGVLVVLPLGRGWIRRYPFGLDPKSECCMAKRFGGYLCGTVAIVLKTPIYSPGSRVILMRGQNSSLSISMSLKRKDEVGKRGVRFERRKADFSPKPNGAPMAIGSLTPHTTLNTSDYS